VSTVLNVIWVVLAGIWLALGWFGRRIVRTSDLVAGAEAIGVDTRR
jgi:uncharacterized membrane protein YccF (DUF307 family)